MHITLRANEKIYINGAVIKVDRKTSIELMNDAVFLLEAHVMLQRDATTPLRQLYFVVQLMLMEPQDMSVNRAMFLQQSIVVANSYDDPDILDGLTKVANLVGKGRQFEALKLIRGLLQIENKRLGPIEPPQLAQAS